MKKLQTAIIYVQRIAEGNNPINNMPADDDAILNNPNVIRCMYFVKDVLEQVQANNGLIAEKAKRGAHKSERALEVFPIELLSEFRYQEDKSVNNFLKQLYEPLGDKKIKKITGKHINDWLSTSGYIVENFNEELLKYVKVPTDKGKSIGMRAEKIQYLNNAYITIFYDKTAQEFIIQNFEKLLHGEKLSE